MRIQSESHSFPDTTTVFQAEISAIYKAMLYMVNRCSTHKVSYFKVLCDSQAAIKALNSQDIRSLAVLNTIHVMNAVADLTISTRLEWVKAHIGIEGNEEADKAAKEGADTPDITHLVDIPWGAKKKMIQDYCNNLWKDRWDNTPRHRQTELFFHHPDKNKAKVILRLSRGYLTTFIRATTGHNFLGKHQNHIDPYISAVCHLCKEDVETFFHFMVECPNLRELQR